MIIIADQPSTWPKINGNELSPNDVIGVSHALNDAAPFDYESRSITFKQLCEGIAMQLKHNGDIPYGDCD